MKNQTKHEGKEKTTNHPQTLWYALYVLFVVLIPTIGSYYLYKFAVTPPPMPKQDLEEWWGPYPIDAKKDESIRTFEIEFTDVMVNDLRERLLHRRPFTPPLEDVGFKYGFNTNFLTQVLDYWQNKYNFNDRANFFNKYNHYKTQIQGLDIHFVHVKPKTSTDDVTVIPLLMLHGWPGSFREFYEVAPKLTAVRPGYDFVFELIIPSLPGFGYSEGAARPGFGPTQTAGVLHQLMRRLGHSRYYIQAGGIGHAVGAAMATLQPQAVRGFHTNSPSVHTRLAYAYMVFAMTVWPSWVVQPELQDRIDPIFGYLSKLVAETGYLHIQATKPDTLGVALTDSPSGLAAYILEKYSAWTNPEYTRATDGRLLEKFQLTHLLDNLMVYWGGESVVTSARWYAEACDRSGSSFLLDEIPTNVPTWGLKLKHALFQPDALLQLKYKNYLHTTMADVGGHFAAMEVPELLADDVFEAVKTFKKFHGEKSTKETTTDEPKQTVYDFTVKDLNGKDVKLDKYKGYVLVIVNVASQCGLTESNYKELNELYEKYQAKGLRILAFPCNQFGGQEPGTRDDIFKFTKHKGVKFDLFEKVEVNGENAHPLWKFLKETKGGTLGDFIKWNFSKFIVDRNGVPVERFAPTVKPLDLEETLAKYW